MPTEGVGPLNIVVAATEASFAATVADGLERADGAVTADAVEPDGVLVRRAREDADGVVVGGDLEGTAVDRLVTDLDVPVVLLADAEQTITSAVEAGVTDVFPRTPARSQCALIAERFRAVTADDAGSSERAARRSTDDASVPAGEAYREVVENVSDGLVIHDPDTGRIVDVNEQFCEMNGYSREELVGEDIGLVTAPGDAYSDEAASEMIELAREKGPQRFDWRNQRKDGETFPVEVHLTLVDLAGAERVLASVRDVTEREELERTYQDIFENVSDGLVVHDPDTGEIRAVNQRYRELTGYTREELVGESIERIISDSPEYTTEQAVANIERAQAEGPQLFEFKGQRKDGSTFLGEVHLTTVELRGTERVLASVRDITDRKRQERELRKSERRLRLIADHLDEIIYLATADFSEILYINPAYEEIYGRPVAELDENPQAFVDAAHPDDRDRYRADVEELVADVEAGDPADRYGGEYRIQRDGETRWVSVGRFPIVNDDGVVDRIVGRVQDITERTRREREFEQIFDGVQDAIAVMEPETLDIVDANEAYLEMVGYESLDAIQQQGIEGLSVTEEGYTAEAGAEIHRRVAETGEPEMVEWRAETSEGTRRWLEVKVAPAVIGGEELNVAIHRDITERRRSEQRFRTIAERVEEIIYLANTDLTEVTYVNSAYADIYGRPVEELEAEPRAFLEAVHPDDRDEYEADIEAMLADIEAGDPDDRYEFEFRIQRPDGGVRWLEATGYPILDGSAQPHQFVGVVTDVTERHRRERTLETFHEATRELTAADSREAACKQAVQAAEDVLGFPLVSAYLYDDGSGQLAPTAVTDRLADLGVDPPPFGPGDSLPWQVFVDGEAVTSSEPSTEVYGPGVSDPDIVLPLGSHGVMLVGAPAASFDAEDVELAQILAATLEAALNHVAGERALAEREAELRQHQERADQLEQLNRIIRDIEQATVEQSSRAGIEEAVSERLVDVDLHELVWIAEPAVGEAGLVLRTSAGGSEAYVDLLSGVVGSPGDGAGGHPAIATYRTGEPRTVENVATDVTAGEWRTHALRHGVQSVVTVPIHYETTTHGVLAVASAEPDAFDEATREVLAELGRSIGYAITVTEREQALESEGTTELEFDVSDEGLFMVRATTTANSRIDLERTIRRAGGTFSMFYAVEGAAPEAVADLANAAPSVETAQVVTAPDDDAGGLVEVSAPTWFGSVFTDHGAVVREATAEGGEGTLVVETPRGSDVRALVEGFQERYPDTDLVAQRQRERTIRSLFELQDALEAELTDRQWEALETAYSAGYFGWPRETSGQEVADLLGVSQPTFNKHLRVAERSAFRMLLDREHPGDDE
ncbi:PAS domain S-box protein [Halorarius halobius]|uniref:PAS domain S-box protein n=1 Tax=Halorarius halobius TaxID=2962671 RepID=UPI0020CB7590|nr:PAS domain S-box protein [Halorarius halobius]